MTLNCHEVFGSILASGVPGVTINATGASDRVVLRNLQIQGIQGGTTVAGTIGVRILAAAVVSIEDCVVTQFAQQGVLDARTAGNTKLFIRNTVISNNVAAGIALAATGAGGNAVEIENSSSINNLFGVATGNGNSAVIKRSVFSGNGTGVETDATGIANVDDTAITNNGTGVTNNGTIRLSNSDVTLNATAFSGGATSTYGNNRMLGNSAFGTALAAVSGQQ